MKRLIIVFALLTGQLFGAFTEFYVQSTASNLNAGSTTSDSALVTYTSAVAVGGWDATTGIFTVASGDPVADGVAVGMFASVYVTSGATVATFVARITARDTTTVTVSLTAVAGSPPATDALGATTMKVGGAWDGPATTVGFPFGFVAATLTDASGNAPRVNIKNGVTYSITAAMTADDNGPIFWEGYTSSVGDGGRATIDGGTSGASYVLLTASGTNQTFKNIIFQNNGATGLAAGVTISGVENTMIGCVVSNTRGHGFNTSGAPAVFIECEAFLCNANSSANNGGFTTSSSSTYIRCISHDNLAGDTDGSGFVTSASATLYIQCIADSNGGTGFLNSATGPVYYFNCDAYNNGADGITLTGASALNVAIENCNFIDNVGWGINSSGSSIRNGQMTNNGYGSGTAANGAGTFTGMGSVASIGEVTYATDLTPYTAPTTGNFSISLAAAKAAGRGAFTETQASYTGTAGSPAIGAAQPSAASSGQKSSVY